MNRKMSNPKDRSSTDKLDLSLWPDTATAYGALAFSEGDFKYGGYNFRKDGVSFNVYYAALKRHMAAVYNGEWFDPQTGVPHLANALACVAVLIDAKECGMLVDDRPPVCQVGELQRDFQRSVRRLRSMVPNIAHRVTQADVANTDNSDDGSAPES